MYIYSNISAKLLYVETEAPLGAYRILDKDGNEISCPLLRCVEENGKYTAAICAGPTVLADLGIVDGKNATCYPGCEDGMGKAQMAENAASVIDGKLITGTSAGCAVPFGLALIEVLKGKEEAERIAKQIVIR